MCAAAGGQELEYDEAVGAAHGMLTRPTTRHLVTLVTLCLLVGTMPAAAQCTIGEIIEQMASSTEALEFAPVEGLPPLDPPAEAQDSETSDEDAPVFVFTPEIQPDQRLVLRRVGQACAWTSDVSNCTFRRVARMALRGRDAAFIYDRCSD